ncbi:hypothetical protein FZ103_01125 [Streptomonospora sp. PA3]|nr:hypothetical protein [Streptomonospora sp. PA3]MUL39793.1 hypothetical protein [Streptomonospora sp. PA3]
MRDLLTESGGHRVYGSALGPVALLSVRRGLTVWCWGGFFRWREDGGAQVTHPAADPEGAARRLGSGHRTHAEPARRAA